MPQSKKSGAAASTTTESLLDQALSKGYRAKKDNSSEAKNDIEALIRVTVDRKGEFSSKKGDRALQEAIDELDKTISKQLAAIMHADELRELEGCGRPARSRSKVEHQHAAQDPGPQLLQAGAGR